MIKFGPQLKSYTRKIALMICLSVLIPATGQSTEVRDVLTANIPNAPGQMLRSITVTYGPGDKSTPHRHEASAFVYVLSGQIRSQVGEAPVRVYGVGDSFFEPAGARHGISENASDTEPATFLVVFIGTKEALSND